MLFVQKFQSLTSSDMAFRLDTIFNYLPFVYTCKSSVTHCNENPIYVFLEKELRGHSLNFHMHVSVVVGLYKSLTDT